MNILTLAVKLQVIILFSRGKEYKMKLKGILLFLIFTIVTVLTGCDNPLLVLDPKGPVAEEQSNVIKLSMWTMAGVVLVVIVLYAFMLTKYRASKSSADYEPPHIEGNKYLEALWIGIPIIIVAFLGWVTVGSLDKVENEQTGYTEDKLTIYAVSSNFKWHFSYPEEDIETVNYLNIPTDRPLEFKLYSYGPISSLWIPQLGGQKYAMSDMVNTLHLAADVPGAYMGRNANFSGEGFAHMEFEALAMPPAEYEEWVKDVKATADELTEDKFNELLEADHVGRSTFNGTHLDFAPAPTGHNHGTDDSEDGPKEDNKDHEEHEHDHK